MPGSDPISRGTAVHSNGPRALSLTLSTANLALFCLNRVRGNHPVSARRPRRFLAGNGGVLASSAAFGLLSRKRSTRRAPEATSAGANAFGGARRRGTDVLMAINVAVFLAQFVSKDRLLLLGAKDNGLIRAGQWWRLITPVFLHANLLHLVSNNYSLNSLGPAVEMLSGRPRFLTVYTASAVAGSAASFLFSPAPSVGASGAIFGLGGALAVYCARHRDLMGSTSDAILRQLGQALALNIAIGFTTPQIDQWGHFGGLVGGALASYLLGPQLERMRDRRGKETLCDNPLIPVFASKL